MDGESKNIGRSGQRCKLILNQHHVLKLFIVIFLKPFCSLPRKCKIIIRFNYLLPPLDLQSPDPRFSFYHSNHSIFHRFSPHLS